MASVLGVAALLQSLLSLNPLFLVNVFLIAGFGAALILVLADRHLDLGVFGQANCVTLIRGGLTVLLLAMIVEDPHEGTAWTASVIAFVILVLDGVDGWLARRNGDVSSFGARFDMETDALFTLSASILVWQFDKAGGWVVASGLMRYAFVAATVFLPWMGRSLPSSNRRKRVFALQAGSLIACMLPIVPRLASSPLALLSLSLLAASFAVDVIWLARRRFSLTIENDHLTVGYGRE